LPRVCGSVAGERRAHGALTPKSKGGGTVGGAGARGGGGGGYRDILPATRSM